MRRRSEAEFLEKYQPLELSGLPKYALLREALLAAIEDGYWQPGNRVPNEAVLASMTPYSLGTVQKAMQDLVQSGVVIRRRGEGTFVAKRRLAMNAPLHLRFEDDSGQPLAIYARIVARQKPLEEGPWSTFFADEQEGLLRIDRIFSVSKLFRVFSSIYVNADRFPLFAKRDATELGPHNFKDVIRREYNVGVQRIQQFLRTDSLPATVCKVLKVPRGTKGSRLELYAVGAGGRPVYYQDAFIPPNPCKLRLADWTPGAYVASPSTAN
jgi:GntR family transcriptional regulator